MALLQYEEISGYNIGDISVTGKFLYILSRAFRRWEDFHDEVAEVAFWVTLICQKQISQEWPINQKTIWKTKEATKNIST